MKPIYNPYIIPHEITLVFPRKDHHMSFSPREIPFRQGAHRGPRGRQRLQMPQLRRHDSQPPRPAAQGRWSRPLYWASLGMDGFSREKVQENPIFTGKIQENPRFTGKIHGWREKLQENPIFTGKIHGFRLRFSRENQSIEALGICGFFWGAKIWNVWQKVPWNIVKCWWCLTVYGKHMPMSETFRSLDQGL